MEFQIVNEVSKFWNQFVPPIFLSLMTMLLFGWVIGKENRNLIMERLSKSNNSSSQYVLQKGIYIPKNQTTKSIFLQSISKRFGFGSLKPLITIFFFILVFFGLNQILSYIFQPMITFIPSRGIYACGVDDYIIANIWIHYPKANTLDQLYAIIIEITKDSEQSHNMFPYTAEAFIRFDLVCCLVMLFRMTFRLRRPKWVSGKVFLRLFAAICILVFALAGTLFSNIQQQNEDTRRSCYQAYSILERQYDNNADEKIASQKKDLETYQDKIEEGRKMYSQNLYYGAFGIRSGITEFLINVVREFQRFFSTYISTTGSGIVEFIINATKEFYWFFSTYDYNKINGAFDINGINAFVTNTVREFYWFFTTYDYTKIP